MSMNVGVHGEYYTNKDYQPRKTDRTKVSEMVDKSGVKADNSVKESSGISTQNEEKLSKKAKEFLQQLREKYGDFDFFVGNSEEDFNALSKSGSKEFSVIMSADEIERMANDAEYADSQMKAVQGAVDMCKRICEERGYASAFGDASGEKGVINKIGVEIDSDGNMKIFAELEKLSTKQKERIEKARDQKAEEKKQNEKLSKKNPYEKDDKDSVKRTVIRANSEEELIQMLQEFDWSKVSDSHSGDRINFTA